MTTDLCKPRGRPKGAAGGALKARIVAAAAAEFARAGYEGARIEAIARRAGCNRAMIYFYFDGKRGLFEAALNAVADQRAAQIGAQPGTLADGLIYWFRQNLADPERVRLVMQEALADLPADAQPAHRSAYLDQQLGSIRAFQAAGLLRADLDPRHLLTLFLALTSFPACFPKVAGAALAAGGDEGALRARWEDCLREVAALLG
jgi:TetR/AcrR family transcriptional regulator